MTNNITRGLLFSILLCLNYQLSLAQEQVRLSSSMDFRQEIYLSDPAVRTAFSLLENSYHNTKRHLLKMEEQERFNLTFINQSNISESDFNDHVLKLVDQLNIDFTMEGKALINHEGYESLLDTVNFFFDVSTKNAPHNADRIWNSRSTWKFQDNITKNTIPVWVIDTPNEIGSYSICGAVEVEGSGIVMNKRDFLGGLDQSSRVSLTLLVGEYFGLQVLYDEVQACRDDYVTDTPRHNSICSVCIPNNFKSSCDNRMYMCGNFMSLAPNSCKSFFTKGQVRRMHFFVSQSQHLQKKILK